MGIINYDERLSSYLFNKTKRSLLALLFGHANESFYVTQIINRLDSGSGAVQRELMLMTEAGIVLREKKGNLAYYRANEKCPIFNDLKSIVAKTSGMADSEPLDFVARRFSVPKDKLDVFSRRHHIKKLALFGSVLRDDFRPDSDIDVLVEFEPGHVPGFAIIDIENELSQLVGRKVDLRTPGDLSRYFRESVVREARVEYTDGE